MPRGDKEPKVVRVPSPGDGRFWDQIQRNGKPEYVFYRPATGKLPESLSYDHFHVIQEEDEAVHYHPLKVSMWELPGLPEEPGPDLWDAVRAYVYAHLDFRDPRLYDVKTAWIFQSWIREAFNVAPYWRYLGTKNTGKTRGLEVDQHLCYRAVLTPSVTEATLYRLIERYRVTYLLDETEHYNVEQKLAIQNVLNSGYRRGQIVPRCETAENGEIIVVGYSPFGPKAIAGSTILKDTLEDRCIPCPMERNTRPVNFNIDIAGARWLRGRLLLWRFRRLVDLGFSEASEASEGSEGYREAPPELHRVKNSRIVELFAPLIALADNEEARQNIISYALSIYDETQEEESTGVEAQVLQAIMDSRPNLESGKFSTRQVADLFNGSRPENEKWKTHTVGKIIKTLGFKPKRMTGGAAGYVYDDELVKRLSERYGLGGALIQPSLGSLASLASPKEQSPGEEMARVAFKHLEREGGEMGRMLFLNTMFERGFHDADVLAVLGMDPRFEFKGDTVRLRGAAETG